MLSISQEIPRRKRRPDNPPLTPDLFGYIGPIAPDAPQYPDRPGFKGAADGPGAEAAVRIAPVAKGLQRDILDFLRRGTAEPLTADQIAGRLGRSILSVRPRVAELHKLGLVEATADRGKNESGMTAHRWRAVQTEGAAA